MIVGHCMKVQLRIHAMPSLAVAAKTKTKHLNHQHCHFKSFSCSVVLNDLSLVLSGMHSKNYLLDAQACQWQSHKR